MTRSNTPREIPQFFVPLPDGRRLSARLWLPEAAAWEGERRSPCILEYLPYRLRDGTAGRDATTHPRFAAAGYACLRVDIAGSGDSDALFDDEYSERELADGEAVIAWAAAQPWCDGRVGIIGISWGGFNGLQLAARAPEALKAVVSVCSTVDRVEDDIHFMGGCLLTDNVNWGAQMSAYMTRPPDPAVRADWRAEWRARLGALPFFAADWLGVADDPAYWRHGSVRFDLPAMRAPVLALGGWADGYVNAPLALAAAVPGSAALIGPWEHKYPHLSRIADHDFPAMVIDWFDRQLKGRETPAPPPARLFMQEHAVPPDPRYRPAEGRWVALPAWPDPSITTRSLGFSPGRLEEADGAGESAVVDTPLRVGRDAAVWCPGMRVDNELCGDQRGEDAASVCFDTAPLDEPLEIIGRACLEIAFTVDRPVAQLVARLCDVAPSGASMRISYRPRNLCCPDSETEAGPVVVPGTAAPLEPGRRYTARILLNTCAHRLRARHRLRLALSTSYWPVLWPAPKRARVTLDLAACRLHLPVHPGAPADPGPPPGCAAESGARILRAPSGECRRGEQDGALFLDTLDDFGAVEIPGHALTTESRVAQRFAIEPENPLSAVHEARWRFALSRGAWGVSIDSTAQMTATAEHFHLTRQVTAREGDDIVLDRTWTRTLARGLL